MRVYYKLIRRSQLPESSKLCFAKFADLMYSSCTSAAGYGEVHRRNIQYQLPQAAQAMRLNLAFDLPM